MKEPRTPEQFIADIKIGVDYGATPWELVWLSDNRQFAIFKKRGSKYWAGRGGLRGYSPTRHVLFDLCAYGRGHSLFIAARLLEVEGRIAKHELESMKSHGK